MIVISSMSRLHTMRPQDLDVVLLDVGSTGLPLCALVLDV
jgi:uncharacterized protein (UPF0212 family)